MMNIVKVLAAGTLAWLVSGCGELVNMGRTRDINPRRVYVNDAARNDSLPAGIVSQGVQFVMQPGKAYVLRMKTSDPSVQLDFRERGASGTYPPLDIIDGTMQNGYLTFLLQPTKSTADYYYAFLQGSGGTRGTTPDSAVRLVSVDTTLADTIAVRLLMVRQLNPNPLQPVYMSDQEKHTYARAFHTELRSIYAGYGVTIDTSTVIVESTGSPFIANFDAASLSIPGTRRPNAVNMYLVDSISIEGNFGRILGYAPRESFDLDSSQESRVILNIRAGTAADLAVTAAHEMGHFFGLRHTTATEQDRGFDRDESNRDDGFSTPYCSSLQKPSASSASAQAITVKSPGGRAYCLRVTGTSFTCSCPDVGNLMYPYGCNPSGQKALGADQRVFLRSNMGLYR